MNRRQRCIMLLAAALSPMAAHAEREDPRIAAEIEATLMRLSDMGALDAVQPQQPLTIERKARVRYELGAVVGLQPGVEEPPIVAITPGGQAERMGLRVGDRILSINDVNLASSDEPGAEFARAVSQAGGRISLRLRRGERVLEIAGQAEAILVPGFRLKIDRPLPVRLGSETLAPIDQ